VTSARALFAFESLAEHLDAFGYPKIERGEFQVIRRDLSWEEREGRVHFQPGSIQLDVGGTEYKGYIYLKHPRNIEMNGMPKFHIGICDKLAEERQLGRFENRYFWSNSPKVDLADAVTGLEYKQVDLALCGLCRGRMKLEFNTTTTVFTMELDLHDQEVVSDEVVLDLFGYPTDWQKISRGIREERHFTCGCCGLQVPPNLRKRGMLHVHHANGDKADNRRANLLCLCVYCHARMDEHHEENFKATSRMRKQLQVFLKIDAGEVQKRDHSLCRHKLSANEGKPTPSAV
jgi:hypothetical protein